MTISYPERSKLSKALPSFLGMHDPYVSIFGALHRVYATFTCKWSGSPSSRSASWLVKLAFFPPEFWIWKQIERMESLTKSLII